MATYDPFDIRGQQESRSDREIEDRLARETEEADVKWLMGSKRGRRIVWRLLEQSHVFASSFNPTAMVMSFREGERNYGLRMLAIIHAHCPELYPAMLKENANGGRTERNADSNPK